MREFSDRKDWQTNHLKECKYVYRFKHHPTSPNKTHWCGWYVIPHRCMFRSCPMLKKEEK